jgi:hypothetical protein
MGNIHIGSQFIEKTIYISSLQLADINGRFSKKQLKVLSGFKVNIQLSIMEID